MSPALAATIGWGITVGLGVLVLAAMYWWFEFCWETSDGDTWGFWLFLAPFAVLLWVSFYMKALQGV